MKYISQLAIRKEENSPGHDKNREECLSADLVNEASPNEFLTENKGNLTLRSFRSVHCCPLQQENISVPGRKFTFCPFCFPKNACYACFHTPLPNLCYIVAETHACSSCSIETWYSFRSCSVLTSSLSPRSSSTCAGNGVAVVVPPARTPERGAFGGCCFYREGKLLFQNIFSANNYVHFLGLFFRKTSEHTVEAPVSRRTYLWKSIIS